MPKKDKLEFGYSCPFCSNPGIKGGLKVKVNEQITMQSMHCPECGESWEDTEHERDERL